MVADHLEQTLRAPPLHFRRRPPQSNYPPDTVHVPASRVHVRRPAYQGWYSKGDSTSTGAGASQSPTYPLHDKPAANVKL